MDPRDRFTETVDAYARYRPDYPDALLVWLEEEAPGRRVIELGAGTGILTRQLLRHGFEVIGVEPNAAMRARAEAQGGTYMSGSAEATGLPDRSADVVIGAQAFHWFDLDRALPEIDRILVPGGLAVAVWNERVPQGFAAAYDAALLRFSATYAGIPKPGPTLEALAERRPDGRRVRFPHAQELDLDGVIGRAWSSSYVVHGVADRARFDAALREAFAAHAVHGRVRLRYDTIGWTWSTPA